MQRAVNFATQASVDRVPLVDVLHHLRATFGATTWTTGHMTGAATHYMRIGDVVAISDIGEQALISEWSILARAQLKKLGERT